ncbi:hypothetical protein [Leptospira gomenensis]|uniref:hypothetical protein n=1 Tax=Leptospira gomenensis TaxID=2484974 RepID=UPI00143856BB|nr:hypothetical protein [Leptospira gomenensis]
MNELGATLQREGPSPELLSRMSILGNRITRSTRSVASLIGTSILIMEMARYV